MSKTTAHCIGAVDWVMSLDAVGYAAAVRLMEDRARAIAAGVAPELVWLLEHPPLLTAGTSARDADLVQPHRFPVFRSGRGGQYTYHGPGQRVVYVMLDVRRRCGSDVRAFAGSLEAWIIEALAALGVDSGRRDGRIGVWVQRPRVQGGGDAKIAALGLRISRGISLHGLSINVAPDLEHYGAIVPCGIRDAGVTSLAALGVAAAMKDVDNVLRVAFERRFGVTRDAELDDGHGPQ